MIGLSQRWRCLAILFGTATSVATAAAQNLLRNPGFESGTTGWGRWGPVETVIATTNFPHSGGLAARVSNRTAKYCGIAQSVSRIMVRGATYHCSGWVRLEGAASQPVVMTIRQIDGGNNGRPRFHNLATNTATSDGWVELAGTFTLDIVGNLSDLHLYFEGPDPGNNFLVDDVAVELVPAVGRTVVAESPDGNQRSHSTLVWSIDLKMKLILIGAVIVGLTAIGVILATLFASRLSKKHAASTRHTHGGARPPPLQPPDGTNS